MAFISNQSLVLPLDTKARLGWLVNFFHAEPNGRDANDFMA